MIFLPVYRKPKKIEIIFNKKGHQLVTSVGVDGIPACRQAGNRDPLNAYFTKHYKTKKATNW